MNATSAINVTIITVNRNNGNGLADTIKSVRKQTYTHYEHIIVDGASSDNSLQVIKEYESSISSWSSEPDTGIYNAMNKGLGRARGEYVLMLNSGDRLASEDVLEKLFATGLHTDIVYTDVLWENDGVLKEERQTNKLGLQFFRQNFLCHQAVYVRRKLHEVVGPYDEGFKIIADQKFLMLAVCRHNASYQHLPIFSAVCEWNGLSKKPESWNLVLAEKKKMIEEEFAALLPDYLEFDRVRKELDYLNRKLYNRLTHRINRLLKK